MTSRRKVSVVRWTVPQRGLRPRCEACAGVKGRETQAIDHPPGEELQWDWAQLPGAPWGGAAHVLVGALSSSNPTQPLPPEYPDSKAFFTVTFFYNETPPR